MESGYIHTVGKFSKTTRISITVNVDGFHVDGI